MNRVYIMLCINTSCINIKLFKYINIYTKYIKVNTMLYVTKLANCRQLTLYTIMYANNPLGALRKTRLIARGSLFCIAD